MNDQKFNTRNKFAVRTLEILGWGIAVIASLVAVWSFLFVGWTNDFGFTRAVPFWVRVVSTLPSLAVAASGLVLVVFSAIARTLMISLETNQALLELEEARSKRERAFSATSHTKTLDEARQSAGVVDKLENGS